MRWMNPLLVAAIVFSMAGWTMACGNGDGDADADVVADMLTPDDTAVGVDNSITPDVVADTAHSDVPGDVAADTASDIPGDTGISDTFITDVPVPEGCCAVADDCPGQVCVNMRPENLFGVCGDAPEPGRCWTDGDCGEGESCFGAALCPCGAACDMGYVGSGFCATTGATCTAVNPDSIAETCDAKSLWVFDGGGCVQTCAGCCGCEPWCDFTWDDEISCQAACATASLGISLDSHGGFLGTGSFDYVLAGHEFRVTDPLGSSSPVMGMIDEATLVRLYDAVEAIDWAAIPEELFPPDNPSCCCDQYRYDLYVVAPMVIPAGVANTSWCSESFYLGLLPPELTDLVGMLADIGGQILSGN